MATQTEKNEQLAQEYYQQLEQALKQKDREILIQLTEAPVEIDWTQTTLETDEKFEEIFGRIGDFLTLIETRP